MQQPDYSTNPFGSPTTPPIEYLRVGFGKRLVAFLIDALISITVTLGIGLLFMALDLGVAQVIQDQIDNILSIYDMMGISKGLIDTMNSLLGGVITAGMIVGVLYPLIEGITGASPGKRILRITVATPDGHPGTIALYLKRYVIKGLGTLLQILALLPALGFLEGIGNIVGIVIFLGYFGVLSSARLALHDLIAQTAVYDVQDIR
ncbi:MAG: RDD family protein [Candidatus Kapabacteria bacterium]|nr:RDD family protein [Candidatus Kapabacteria bacterium]